MWTTLQKKNGFQQKKKLELIIKTCCDNIAIVTGLWYKWHYVPRNTSSCKTRSGASLLCGPVVSWPYIQQPDGQAVCLLWLHSALCCKVSWPFKFSQFSCCHFLVWWLRGETTAGRLHHSTEMLAISENTQKQTDVSNDHTDSPQSCSKIR